MEWNKDGVSSLFSFYCVNKSFNNKIDKPDVFVGLRGCIGMVFVPISVALRERINMIQTHCRARISSNHPCINYKFVVFFRHHFTRIPVHLFTSIDLYSNALTLASFLFWDSFRIQTHWLVSFLLLLKTYFGLFLIANCCGFFTHSRARLSMLLTLISYFVYFEHSCLTRTSRASEGLVVYLGKKGARTTSCANQFSISIYQISNWLSSVRQIGFLFDSHLSMNEKLFVVVPRLYADPIHFSIIIRFNRFQLDMIKSFAFLTHYYTIMENGLVFWRYTDHIRFDSIMLISFQLPACFLRFRLFFCLFFSLNEKSDGVFVRKIYFRLKLNYFWPKMNYSRLKINYFKKSSIIDLNFGFFTISTLLNIIDFFFVTGLSRAQRQLARSLNEFNFECIGSTQTDDEQVIVDSLKQFSKLISNIEDERDNMVSSILN